MSTQMIPNPTKYRFFNVKKLLRSVPALDDLGGRSASQFGCGLRPKQIVA